MKFVKEKDPAAWLEKNRMPEYLKHIARPIPWYKLDKKIGAVCLIEKDDGKIKIAIPETQEEQKLLHDSNWPNVSWFYVKAAALLKICPTWKEECDDSEAD